MLSLICWLGRKFTRLGLACSTFMDLALALL